VLRLPDSVRPVDSVNAARGVDVFAGTGVPRWTGERMDLGMVVDGLLQADARKADGVIGLR